MRNHLHFLIKHVNEITKLEQIKIKKILTAGYYAYQISRLSEEQTA